MGKNRAVSCAELVLDVETKTQRVILKKKVCLCLSSLAIYQPVSYFYSILKGTYISLSVQEPGKRSQLWRMTGTGMLCHEGSSPPQSKPSQPRPLSSSLVLDIAGLAAVTDNRLPTHFTEQQMTNCAVYFKLVLVPVESKHYPGVLVSFLTFVEFSFLAMSL